MPAGRWWCSRCLRAATIGCTPPRWLRAGHRVALIATSDYGELERALRLLRVIPMMQRTRILLFPPARGTKPACSPEEVKKRLGADVVAVEQKTFEDLITGADEAAVRAEIKAWTNGAKEIIEPTKEDIEKAARVSVALDRLIEQEQADGLAIGTCMGWLDRGFPCLGFTRLRDRGVPAACEGDMDSLLTMLLFQYALDLPGFQGNATFDTARNALWTAHCTAPLKMDGPDGKDAPYLLRGHSEVGGSGCVPEVQYRLGQTITRAKFVNLNTILASTGTIIEVPERAVHGCPHPDCHRSRRRRHDGGELEQRTRNGRRHDVASPCRRLRRPHGEPAAPVQPDGHGSPQGGLTQDGEGEGSATTPERVHHGSCSVPGVGSPTGRHEESKPCDESRGLFFPPVRPWGPGSHLPPQVQSV